VKFFEFNFETNANFNNPGFSQMTAVKFRTLRITFTNNVTWL